MSGETEKAVSGWTTDTLKALVDERAAWQERMRLADKEAAEASRVLAKIENDRRLEELNNLRRDYTNDRGGFVTVAQFESFKALQDERYGLILSGLAELKLAVSAGQANKSGLTQGLGYVIAAVVAVLAVASYLTR